jgi:hypothetical protein
MKDDGAVTDEGPAAGAPRRAKEARAKRAEPATPAERTAAAADATTTADTTTTTTADVAAPADAATTADTTTTAAAATAPDAATAVGDENETGRLRAAAASIADAASSLVDAASGLAEAASTLAGSAAAPVAGAASSVARPILHEVDELRMEARRRLDDRPGARIRRVRRMGARPLPNLYDLYPEVRRASMRELGVQTVAIEEICGTAVEGPVQRGGDFLPTRERRGSDWLARWERIRRANEKLAILPPVDLVKVADCYWVVDGHNRVAAALYNGQIAIDAVVVELRLPGVAATSEPTRIAEYLQSTRDIRAAGEGRLSRTVVRRDDAPAREPHRHVGDEEEPAGGPP